MTDAPNPVQNKKTFLRAIRDVLQWLLHMALIPFITLLTMIDAGAQHLLMELRKF